MDKMEINKPISLEERKNVQFEMLKEIDSFCRSNGIRYSLAFGTLLGAIRHRGFIPWDDDVDIMMPLSDMKRFKSLFHSETMKYYDVDNDPDFQYAFSRIANTKTFCKIGFLFTGYGICIDLYPIIPIPREPKKQVSFWEKAVNLEKRYVSFVKWNNRAIRYLPVKRLPGFSKTMKEYRDFLFGFGNESNNSYYIIAGPMKLRNKMTYDFDLFEDLIDVEFEGQMFRAVSCYDKYLTMRYDNYMQLPPEDQRQPYHGGNYFWK